MYDCRYYIVSVPLSDCFIYGPYFNQANQESGHAYGDPATGARLNVQTSPSLEDQIVNALVARGPIKSSQWSTFADLEPAAQRQAARTVAKECERASKVPGSGVGKRDCIDRPIFAPGSDVATATQHDAEALAGNPEWFLLHYQSEVENASVGKTRPLYSLETNCSAGRVIGVTECDEYPWFATAESSTSSSFRQIPKEDNWREGNLYQGFVYVCGLASGTMGSEDREFLVIPLVGPSAPPTLGWCLPHAG